MRRCKVVIKDKPEGKTQIVVMPDGTEIPCQIWSRVHAGIHPSENYAIVKVYVDFEKENE